MNWKDRFYDFIADWLRSQGLDVDKVIDVEEDSYESGGCPTCSYTVRELEITWLDSNGEQRREEFNTTLVDLFN